MKRILPQITSVARNFIAEKKYKQFYEYVLGKELTGMSLLRDATNFIYPFLGLNTNVALNRVLTTDTSFLFVPFTGFIPLHTYVEKYTMMNDVDYTPADIEGFDIPEYQETTYRGKDYYIAPPIGDVAYQRRVNINGEYYRNNDVVLKALTLKIPDMVNALWATLSELPVQVPAFYFSKSLGTFIGQPDFVSKLTKDNKEMKLMLLNSIDMALDSSTNVITINIELIESYKSSYGTNVQYPSTATSNFEDIKRTLDNLGFGKPK